MPLSLSSIGREVAFGDELTQQNPGQSCSIMESLHWTILPNNSWREWWYWRKNPIKQRVHATSKIGPVCQVRVTCCLDQHGIETQVPSTSRDWSNSWIIIFRGPNRYVDESWHDQGNPPRNVEMVSSTSIEQSHAITTSIEETHATKQQETSSIPMNYSSEEFIPIDKRNDIPACDNVDKYVLGWKICDIPVFDNVKRTSVAEKVSQKVTVFVRHRERHREIDGAVHWSSLSLVLRRDFEREGSDSQRLGNVYTEEATNPGFSIAWSWIVESCCDTTETERTPVPCRKLFPVELDSTSRAHRKWKGHQREATDGLHHTI